MKPFIEITEAEGKTIEAVALECGGESLLLTFTDGTFSLVRGGLDFEDPIVRTEAADLLNLPRSEAIRLGVITAEEVAEAKAAEQAYRKSECERSERKHYEQLKRKFEGK